MTEQKLYQSVKLEWGMVSLLIGEMISGLLHRTVRCKTSHDELDYWAAEALFGHFTIDDLESLLNYVGADGEMRLNTLTFDSEDTASVDMDLARALLRKKIKTSWKAEFAAEDGLWLMGVDADAMELPEPDGNICFIDNTAVDLRTLLPKDELLDSLFGDGGTVSTLSELCDQYVRLYGNELYWAYPITDGRYNGVYFVLVQEGALCLPYYEIDRECFELFERDGVRLLTAGEMSYFIREWEQNSEILCSAMKSIHNNLTMREKENGT